MHRDGFLGCWGDTGCRVRSVCLSPGHPRGTTLLGPWGSQLSHFWSRSSQLYPCQLRWKG